MALTEEQIEDKIEVVGEHRIVQVRTATVIKRDDVEISSSFSRHVVLPGQDATGESAEVQAVIAALHTDAVVAAYAASIEE
tara:strand:+ start:587 stop:829 length:243 start_codon:yes stop_codon:yes gene_type:complete